MKTLILGGTGLISTELVRQLLERGDHVTAYNRGQAGIVLPVSVERLTGDRTDPQRFRAEMRKAGEFDCVFDMVCYQPGDAESMIDAFSQTAGRVVMASTVDVYTKPARSYPIREDAPVGGVNDYGRGKSQCEALLMNAYRESAFPVTILRLVHCYGPGGVHRGHIVHSLGGRTILLDRLRKGKPIVVHGDGSSLWTSCHIDDVARGFIQAATSPLAVGKQYNLSGDETVTWDQYHLAVAEALGGAPPQIVHVPTDLLLRLWPERAATTADNFQFNNIFDNSAAKRDFGFATAISLHQGLPPTIEWVERTYGFDNSDNDVLYDALIAAWNQGITATERLTLRTAGK